MVWRCRSCSDILYQTPFYDILVLECDKRRLNVDNVYKHWLFNVHSFDRLMYKCAESDWTVNMSFLNEWQQLKVVSFNYLFKIVLKC